MSSTPTRKLRGGRGIYNCHPNASETGILCVFLGPYIKDLSSEKGKLTVSLGSWPHGLRGEFVAREGSQIPSLVTTYDPRIFHGQHSTIPEERGTMLRLPYFLPVAGDCDGKGRDLEADEGILRRPWIQV